jgi:cell division protein FtsB
VHRGGTGKQQHGPPLLPPTRTLLIAVQASREQVTTLKRCLRFQCLPRGIQVALPMQACLVTCLLPQEQQARMSQLQAQRAELEAHSKQLKQEQGVRG